MEADAKSPPLWRRRLCVLALAGLYALILLVSFVFVRGHQRVFEQLGMMEDLPLPTQAVLGLANLTRSFWWIEGLAFAAAAGLVGWGKLDRWLTGLLVLCVIVTGVLFYGTVIGVQMPIVGIQHKLAE